VTLSILAPGMGAAAGAAGPSPMIAFVRYSLSAPYDSHIFVINPDRGGVRQLAHRSALGPKQDLTPDGKPVVVERLVNQGTDAEAGAVDVVGADGTGLHRLTPGDASSPAWSPNGRRIAYIAYNSDIAYNSGAGRLFVMKADGSSKRQLAASAGECCYASSPTWSPDGRQIAYSRGGVIYTVHADGSAQRPLTPGSSFDCAAWSPNGPRI